MRFGSRLVLGAVAGIAGTMAMTAAMRRLHGRLPARDAYPLPPRELVDVTLDPPANLAPALTTAAHFAYGAGCGALVGAINPRPSSAEGAAAGIAIWLGSYMGWIPAAGLLEPATRHPAKRNALMLGVHLVWGAATALALRELAAAEESIFADGPDRDAARVSESSRPSG